MNGVKHPVFASRQVQYAGGRIEFPATIKGIAAGFVKLEFLVRADLMAEHRRMRSTEREGAHA